MRRSCTFAKLASFTVVVALGSFVVGAPATPAEAVSGAAVTLTGAASPTTGVAVGDPVIHTFTGTNSGTVSLDAVTIDDPADPIPGLTCTPSAPAHLDPGETMTCTAESAASASEIADGGVGRIAVMQDAHDTGAFDFASAVATASPANQWSIVDTGTAPAEPGLGSIVQFAWVIDATGGSDLRDTVLTDDLVGGSAISCSPVAIGPGSTIPVGGFTKCTATYALAQADVDAGVVSTAWTADTSTDSGRHHRFGHRDVYLANTPALTATATATPTTGVIAGDVVGYTVSGHNSSHLTLHNVAIGDALPGLSALACVPSLPATLAPGDDINCTASAPVTQAQVDAGSFVNAATITGESTTHGSVSVPTSVTVAADQVPSIAVTATPSAASGVVAGEVVTFAITDENMGTVTLHDVGFADSLAGLGTPVCTRTVPATLAPGNSVACTADYTVTQADVDAGSFVNTVTTSGVDPANSAVGDSSGAAVTAAVTGGLSVVAAASPAANVVPGDVVNFSAIATNTGAVSLHGVDLTGSLAGASALTCAPTPPATLAPGEAITCAGTYVVTTTDPDVGSIVDTFTVAGLTPTDVPVSATDFATVGVDTSTSLSISNFASPTTNVGAGATVNYAMLVTNTGARTLDVTVTDPLPGLSPVTCSPGQGAALVRGATMTCSAAYTVTQADYDAGAIFDTAIATGTDSGGATVTAQDGAAVLVGGTPSIGVTGTMSPSTSSGAGDTATFTFTVTNTGGLPLNGVSLALTHEGLSTPNCTPTQPAALARGASMVCTSTYTVTQADVDSRGFTITALVTGTDPIDLPVGSVVDFDVTLQAVQPASPAAAATSANGATETAVMAFTGSDSRFLGLLALAMIAAGAGLVSVSRRRRITT